jgi:hypothetical protein
MLMYFGKTPLGMARAAPSEQYTNATAFFRLRFASNVVHHT